MGLRISAGKFKGRKLKSPPGREIRPLSGMIKEALFSILGNMVEGKMFFDFFAGTGSAGLEALSRGAGRAVFVEKSPRRIKIIKENISLLGLEDESEVFQTDVFNFIHTVTPGIIFAGPNYKDNLSSSILKYAVDNEILTKENILIIQHHKKESVKLADGTLLKDSRKYGISKLDFFGLEDCIH